MVHDELFHYKAIIIKKVFLTAQPLLKMMPQTHALLCTSANMLLECTVSWNNWQAYIHPHAVIL